MANYLIYVIGATGILIVNMLPLLISLSILRLPRCLFKICFTIVKPSPVPPLAFDRDSSTL